MTVYVIGNATRDWTFRVARLPGAGESVLSSDRMADWGGKGLNQAVAAARAGAGVHFFCPVGTDEAGTGVVAELRRHVGLTVREWKRELPTDESFITVADGGENAIVTTAACAHSVTPDEVVGALADARAGDVLVMQGNLSQEATKAGLSVVLGRGLRTVLNPAPFRFALASLLPVTTILVANESEAAEAGRPEAVLTQMPKGSAFIVTLGARGCVVHRANAEAETFPVPQVAAVDTAGAGDAFAGVLAAGLSLGVPLLRVVQAATDMAAEVVTRPGTYGAIAALSPPRWGDVADERRPA